nr:MAG TPA: hypothetical protein [Caudoviricetes sp.]
MACSTNLRNSGIFLPSMLSLPVGTSNPFPLCSGS